VFKRILLASVLAAVLSGCGYQGFYRYPCQDPANWEMAECKPPVCEVNKICPKDLNTNITEETEGTTNG
jgi:hypothetical protein